MTRSLRAATALAARPGCAEYRRVNGCRPACLTSKVWFTTSMQNREQSPAHPERAPRFSRGLLSVLDVRGDSHLCRHHIIPARKWKRDAPFRLRIQKTVGPERGCKGGEADRSIRAKDQQGPKGRAGEERSDEQGRDLWPEIIAGQATFLLQLAPVQVISFSPGWVLSSSIFSNLSGPDNRN